MNLTMRAARDLHGAIDRILAGRPKALRVNNEDQIVVEPFSFAGDAALALAININRLKPHVDAHNEAYRRIVMVHSKGTGSVKQDTPEYGLVFEAENKLLDVEIEGGVKLLRVPLADIKPTDNKLSPGELARLAPVLKFDQPKYDESE